jgi:N-methylhydantoinase A
MPGVGGGLRLDQQGGTGPALKGHRAVRFPDAAEPIRTPVYDRYALATGTTLPGPAVFEENESTFIVGPDARIEVLPDGSILAERLA